MTIIIVLHSLIGFGRMNYFKLILSTSLCIIYFCDLKKIFSIRNIIYFVILLLSVFIIACLMMYFRVFSGEVDVFNIVSYQLKQIFEYILGSFRALDRFINNGFVGFENYTFGRATFAGVEEILLYPIKFLGSEITSFNQNIAPITQQGIVVGYETPYYNAFYTSIMNFYLDFRIMGVVVFSLLQGLLVKYALNIYVKEKNIISMVLVLYVSLNLITGFLRWEYQAGNNIFLLIVLFILAKFDKIKKPRKENLNENIVDS